MFRTAARLRAAVFYRGILLLLVPVLAVLAGGQVSAPTLFISGLVFALGLNGFDIFSSYIGRGAFARADWYLVADSTIIFLLAASSGGPASPFVILLVLMVVYAATWFDRRIAWRATVLATFVLLALYLSSARAEIDVEQLVAGLLLLLGAGAATGEIADLVAVTRARIVHASTELIRANKRILAQQASLQDSEARLRLVLDSAAEGIFGVDLDGRCTFVNRACIKMLGYREAADLLGRNIHDLAHHTRPDGRPYPSNECVVGLATQRGEGAHSDQDFHWRADGSSFPVEYWSHPIRRGGEVVGAVVTVIDITARKYAEGELRRLNLELEDRVTRRTSELVMSNARLTETLETLRRAKEELVHSEKLASLGALVAGVAHELSTPLGNALVVATTLAERTEAFGSEAKSGALRRSSLADYLANANRASDLLVRNLDAASNLIARFKQVAVDQTSDQRRTFDLAQVLGEVLVTLKPQFKRTPHRIDVAVPEGIAMDSFPGRLGQVITNLVNNALTHAFCESTPGVVRIRGEAREDRVHINVSDDGRGIPDAHRTKIFDPFFTTRMGQGGSGLGLYIVHGIVTRLLGGSIQLVRGSAKGASFDIDLPLTAPASAVENQRASAGGDPDSDKS